MSSNPQPTIDKEAPGDSSKRPWRNLDWVSVGSFIVAPALGALAIASNIRSKFFDSFILGYRETRTPFSDIVDEYTHREDGKFAKNTRSYNAGILNAEQYVAANKEAVTQYHTAIGEKLEREFNIPTKGFRGWSEGTWKRWGRLGQSARISSTVAFSTLAVTALGAVAVLRNSKSTIDRVEDKIDAGHSR